MNLAFNIVGNKIFFGKKVDFDNDLKLHQYGPLTTWTKRLLSPKDFVLVLIGKYLNSIKSSK